MKNDELTVGQTLTLASLTLIGFLVLFGIAWFISAISIGFVITKFWAWFMLPLFPMLPTLGVWQAVGLSMTVSILKGISVSKQYKNHEEKGMANLATILITPWVILFFGWMVHLIIGA